MSKKSIYLFWRSIADEYAEAIAGKTTSWQLMFYGVRDEFEFEAHVELRRLLLKHPDAVVYRHPGENEFWLWPGADKAECAWHSRYPRNFGNDPKRPEMESIEVQRCLETPTGFQRLHRLLLFLPPYAANLVQPEPDWLWIEGRHHLIEHSWLYCLLVRDARIVLPQTWNFCRANREDGKGVRWIGEQETRDGIHLELEPGRQMPVHDERGLIGLMSDDAVISLSPRFTFVNLSHQPPFVAVVSSEPQRDELSLCDIVNIHGVRLNPADVGVVPFTLFDGVAHARRRAADADAPVGLISVSGALLGEMRWRDIRTSGFGTNCPLAPAQDAVTGQWGFIDLSGNAAIEPRWDWTDTFCSDNRAIVSESYGRTGVIDETGTYVIAPVFKTIKRIGTHSEPEIFECFSADGQISVIDQNGTVIIGPHTSLVSTFYVDDWETEDFTGYRSVVSYRRLHERVPAAMAGATSMAVLAELFEHGPGIFPEAQLRAGGLWGRRVVLADSFNPNEQLNIAAGTHGTIGWAPPQDDSAFNLTVGAPVLGLSGDIAITVPWNLLRPG